MQSSEFGGRTSIWKNSTRCPKWKGQPIYPLVYSNCHIWLVSLRSKIVRGCCGWRHEKKLLGILVLFCWWTKWWTKDLLKIDGYVTYLCGLRWFILNVVRSAYAHPHDKGNKFAETCIVVIQVSRYVFLCLFYRATLYVYVLVINYVSHKHAILAYN